MAELLTGVPLFPGQDAGQQLELIIACCPVPEDSKLRHEINREIPGRDLTPNRSLRDTFEVTWRSGNGQEDFDHQEALALMTRLLQFEPEGRAQAADLAHLTPKEEMEVVPMEVTMFTRSLLPRCLPLVLLSCSCIIQMGILDRVKGL